MDAIGRRPVSGPRALRRRTARPGTRPGSPTATTSSGCSSRATASPPISPWTRRPRSRSCSRSSTPQTRAPGHARPVQARDPGAARAVRARRVRAARRRPDRHPRCTSPSSTRRARRSSRCSRRGALPVPAVAAHRHRRRRRARRRARRGRLPPRREAGEHHRRARPTSDQPDVTLIDFGFARSPWLDESIRDELVGTVRYLAPEAAGLLQSAGRRALRPVRARRRAVRVPRRHARRSTRRASATCCASTSARRCPSCAAPQPVPRALAAVVHRLLRKDPAERYQSAAAVRGRPRRRSSPRIAAGDPDPSVVIGRLDRRGDAHRPGLRRPRRRARRADRGRPRAAGGPAARRLVLLEADSGGGKSRLLAEVATPRRRGRRDRAARARASRSAGSARSRCCTAWPTGWSTVARRGPGAARSRSRADLADVAPAIVRALPALAALLGAAEPESDTGPEQFGELRSLGRAAPAARPRSRPPQRPVLLVLDDCQWADALTMRLLADLFAEQRRRRGTSASSPRSGPRRCRAEHPLRAITGARTRPPRPAVAARRWRCSPNRWPARCPPRPPRPSCGWPTATRSWPPPCCAAWSSRRRSSPSPDGWTVDADPAARRAGRAPLGGVPRPAARAARTRGAATCSASARCSASSSTSRLAVADRRLLRRRRARSRGRPPAAAALGRRDARRDLHVLPRQDPRGAARPARPTTPGASCTAGRPTR